MTHRASRVLAAVAAAVATASAAPRAAGAQADFYNTDAGRPMHVEDATAIERHAMELQVAPVRLERARGGLYHWGVEPELAWGLLPRTQLEVGLPLAWADGPTSGRRAGIAGIDVSALHQLNIESRTLPALALGASVLAPVGALAVDRAYASAKAIATRTFGWGRAHANAAYTFGDAPGVTPADAPGSTPGDVAGPAAMELARWTAGIAVDRTFPVRALLVSAELFAREALAGESGDAPVEWNAGLGTRVQLDPRWGFDAGVGRRLTGDDRAWYLTAGAAFTFALPTLVGTGGR